MNETNKYARRYHWLGDNVTDFVNEPHSAILSETRGLTLNLIAGESDSARATITDIANETKPENLLTDLKKITTLSLPAHHPITVSDIHPDSLSKILLSVYERQPEDFEKLLGLPGVGAKTLRALSLISELVYGVAPSYRDPARYSFAHGGKDGFPYPVDRETYDKSIEYLAQAINKTLLGIDEKNQAMNRLHRLSREES
jgi:hypothetical protein